jgi:hypothetical protein
LGRRGNTLRLLKFKQRSELWDTAYRDKERAETVALYAYPVLRVDQGEVICDARKGSRSDLVGWGSWHPW